MCTTDNENVGLSPMILLVPNDPSCKLLERMEKVSFVFLTFVQTILTTSTGSSEAQHGLSMVGALDSSWRAGEVDSSDPPEFRIIAMREFWRTPPTT